MEKCSVKERYVIGVDAGGTKVAYGLFNSQNKIVDRYQHATDAGADGPSFSDTIIEVVKTLLEKNDLTFEHLDGVGICMPSFINMEAGLVYMTSSMPLIKNFEMREYCEKRLEARVILDNDANGAALAEFMHGAGRGTQHMVYVVLGTGLGSGIIINGKIFSGSYGAAGECGHMLATPNSGIMCGCENTGCYMSYITGKHLPERVRLGLANGIDSKLTPETADGRKLLEAYKVGDTLAQKMIHEMAHYLALCVFNIYQMLNIDTFVFGGGLTGLGDVLFDRMREEFAKYYHISFPVHFKIAQLQEDIGIIGAAELVKSEK